MQYEPNTSIQIQFLESMNEEMRRRVALGIRKTEQESVYWPMILCSGLISFSAWTLSWIS